jgi:hypothetical protein
MRPAGLSHSRPGPGLVGRLVGECAAQRDQAGADAMTPQVRLARGRHKPVLLGLVQSLRHKDVGDGGVQVGPVRG